MTIPPADQACPVDLDYPDAEPPRLDLPAIIRRGRRARRGRWARACAAVAACAVAAGLIFTVLPPAGPPANVPGTSLNNPELQQQLALNPPAGQPVKLSSLPGWATIAWATRHGSVCWATEPVPGRHDQGDSDCWTRPDIPGEGHWLNLPTTSVAPHLGSANLAPWYGLAPPAASRVVLTFFGRTFTARPVRLPLPGGRTVSVFLVLTLVPGDGNAHWAASDISREVAYNRSGQIVASHGRWR